MYFNGCVGHNDNQQHNDGTQPNHCIIMEWNRRGLRNDDCEYLFLLPAFEFTHEPNPQSVWEVVRLIDQHAHPKSDCKSPQLGNVARILITAIVRVLTIPRLPDGCQ